MHEHLWNGIHCNFHDFNVKTTIYSSNSFIISVQLIVNAVTVWFNHELYLCNLIAHATWSCVARISGSVWFQVDAAHSVQCTFATIWRHTSRQGKAKRRKNERERMRSNRIECEKKVLEEFGNDKNWPKLRDEVQFSRYWSIIILTQENIDSWSFKAMTEWIWKLLRQFADNQFSNAREANWRTIKSCKLLDFKLARVHQIHYNWCD